MNLLFDVNQALPVRGKEVYVLINDKKYLATLLHNDWHFNEKHSEELGLKTMNDHYIIANKITNWMEK